MAEQERLNLPMRPRASGVTYWITGLPGAGKTTLAGHLAARIAEQGRSIIQLDGDRMRAILGGRFSYGQTDRLALAHSYARLCQELSGQGHDVVCATVSMFHEVRRWSRANTPRYREIYLKVPIEILTRRHPKGLYAAALAGRMRNVPGVDLTLEAPEAPDIVIEDDGTKSPDAVAAELFQFLHLSDEAVHASR
jgi:adenylylsulfate kinase